MADPNRKEAGRLFGVISGINLPVRHFELAPGLRLTPIIAEIFSSPMIAFSLPEIGKPHPGPWSALDGGMIFRCRAQIEVFADDTFKEESLESIAWLVTAAIRLHFEANIRLVATGGQPFVKETTLAPAGALYESNPNQWGIFRKDDPTIVLDELKREALSLQLPRFSKAWGEDRFKRAFTIFDQSRFSASAESCSTLLWTSLEVLFGLSASQNKGRKLATAITAFIAEPELTERALKTASDLYRKRGSVVHAGAKLSDTDFIQLFRLASVVFQRSAVHGLPVIDER